MAYCVCQGNNYKYIYKWIDNIKLDNALLETAIINIDNKRNMNKRQNRLNFLLKFTIEYSVN